MGFPNGTCQERVNRRKKMEGSSRKEKRLSKEKGDAQPFHQQRQVDVSAPQQNTNSDRET
jgi:hypothetical protein